MRGNAAAVREAILLHARPVLIPSASPGCEPLSASHWKQLSSILAALMPVFWFSVIKGLWGSVKVLECVTIRVLIQWGGQESRSSLHSFTLAQHTSAVFSSGPSRSDQDGSASTQFKRIGGWSADEVACLHHNDPCLLEDRHLACWRRTIVHTAGKCARNFINRAFPENQLYWFCKLPQWPTVLPWIARQRDRGFQAPVPENHCSGACALQATPVSRCNSPLASDYVSLTACNRPQPRTPAVNCSPGEQLCILAP
jgi:hypothetical protein